MDKGRHMFKWIYKFSVLKNKMKKKKGEYNGSKVDA